MVVTALKSDQELSQFPPTLIPHDPQWSNFIEAVQFLPFGTYLWNTSVITFFSILGAAISNPIIAYGFSRIQWPGQGLLLRHSDHLHILPRAHGRPLRHLRQD